MNSKLQLEIVFMSFKKHLASLEKFAEPVQALFASNSFKLFILGMGILVLFFTIVMVIRKLNRLKRAFKVADEASKLERFVESANFRIKTYQKEFRDNLNFVSSQGSESLSITIRILRTLNSRLDEVEKLLKRGREDDIREAKKLLSSKLDDVKSSIDNVISADPVPELSPSEWMPAINKLIDSMDRELTRVENISGKLTDSVVLRAQEQNASLKEKTKEEERKYRRRMTFRSLVKHLES